MDATIITQSKPITPGQVTCFNFIRCRIKQYMSPDVTYQEVWSSA